MMIIFCCFQDPQTAADRNQRELVSASMNEVIVVEQDQHQNALDIITHTVITDSVRIEPTEESEINEVISIASLYDENKEEEPEAEAEVGQDVAINPEPEIIPVNDISTYLPFYELPFRLRLFFFCY